MSKRRPVPILATLSSKQAAPPPLPTNNSFVQKTRKRADQGVIVSGTQSQYKSYYTRFVNWIIEHSEMSAASSAYFEIVEKGRLVTAEEIIAAGVYPLAGPANLDRFIHEYYLEHGRVNGIGETSEHMLETMTRSVQNGRAKEQYMVKLLGDKNEEDSKAGLSPYWTPAQTRQYAEEILGLGLGVRYPELKKLRKATRKETEEADRQNCVDTLIGTEAFSWNETHHMEWCTEVHSKGTARHYRTGALMALSLTTILRGVNVEEMEFTVMQRKTLGTAWLITQQQIPMVGYLADHTKTTGRHMTGVASHRNPVMCANSMMGSWILWRYIPKEKGGWGGRFPSCYDREALFNKPLICKQEKNDLKVGLTESEAREDIRWAMDAILGQRLMMHPKDIPSEWYEHIRHGGRVSGVGIMCEAGLQKQRQCTAGGWKGESSSALNNFYAWSHCDRKVCKTMAGFEADEHYVLEWQPAGCPRPSPEMCSILVPDIYAYRDKVLDPTDSA